MNQLKSASKGSTSAWFWYDGFGRTCTRQIGSTVLFQVYDGWNLVEEYKHTDDSLDSRYLWGAGPGELLSLYTSGQTYYLYQDGRNNTSQIADANAMVQESYKYDLNGTPTVYDPSGNEMPNGSAIGNRFLFGGQEYYQELGLINLRNRFYLPELGRFLQPDPIGFSGDPSNLYRYCGNNPVNRSDPSGEYVAVVQDPKDPSHYTLNIPITFHGGTGTQQSQLISGIQSWAGTYNGTRIDVHVYQPIFGGLFQTTNDIYLSDSFGPSTTPISGISPDVGYWQLAGQNLQALGTHEGGHLMGLPDGYDLDTFQVLDGWDPCDIMANPTDGQVSDQDIGMVLQSNPSSSGSLQSVDNVFSYPSPPPSGDGSAIGAAGYPLGTFVISDSDLQIRADNRRPH